MSHVPEYFAAVSQVAAQINYGDIELMAHEIRNLRERNGRLFVIGLGGSAANASHAVNDFRKLCDVEAYAPTDNVSELTARANDDGMDTVFSNWLIGSRVTQTDALLVISVGGGNLEQNVSVSIVKALQLVSALQATVLGIVGRDGGYTKRFSKRCVLIPRLDDALVTPLTESFQSVVLHCLVSHPFLQKNKTKW